MEMEFVSTQYLLGQIKVKLVKSLLSRSKEVHVPGRDRDAWGRPKSKESLERYW